MFVGFGKCCYSASYIMHIYNLLYSAGIYGKLI